MCPRLAVPEGPAVDAALPTAARNVTEVARSQTPVWKRKRFRVGEIVGDVVDEVMDEVVDEDVDEV
ncbi:hypothetical protein LSAT2_015196, partial [Lamellibrachia satsuma]